MHLQYQDPLKLCVYNVMYKEATCSS